MKMRSTVGGGLLLCLLVITGCSSTRTHTQTKTVTSGGGQAATTPAAFRLAANRACARLAAQERLVHIGLQTNQRTMVRGLQREVSARRQEIVALEALRPPIAKRTDYADLLAVERRVLALDIQILDFQRKHEGASIIRVGPRLSRTLRAEGRLAKLLSLRSCDNQR